MCNLFVLQELVELAEPGAELCCGQMWSVYFVVLCLCIVIFIGIPVQDRWRKQELPFTVPRIYRFVEMCFGRFSCFYLITPWLACSATLNTCEDKLGLFAAPWVSPMCTGHFFSSRSAALRGRGRGQIGTRPALFSSDLLSMAVKLHKNWLLLTSFSTLLPSEEVIFGLLSPSHFLQQHKVTRTCVHVRMCCPWIIF